MTLLPPTRKRIRSCEEEDFLPLSKKINNLHINNWKNIESSQERLIEWNNSTDQFLSLQPQSVGNERKDRDSTNSSLCKSPPENSQNGYNETEMNGQYKDLNIESYKHSDFSQGKYMEGENNSQNERIGKNNWPRIYNPDLGVNENPYYYESNKLLFGLYIERLQRGGY